MVPDPALNPHAFDAAVALVAQPDGAWLGHTGPAYANMVGPYGGITAAQALTAVLRHPQLLGEPVSLTVNFAAALVSGPFVIRVHPARTNRSTQHWVIEMLQDGQTVLTGTALTAVRRDTWSLDDKAMPACPGPADVPRRQLPLPMEWINRYEMRPVTGALTTVWDGSGDNSLSQHWMRDDPPRALDFASLTAISDQFFPSVWRRRAKHVPAGTVSMTVYFHASAPQLRATGTGYLLGQARAQTFRNGYFDQTAQLWNEAGELLATTHQIVYYKE